MTPFPVPQAPAEAGRCDTVAAAVAVVTFRGYLGTGVTAADVPVTVVTVIRSTVVAGATTVTLIFRVPSQAKPPG